MSELHAVTGAFGYSGRRIADRLLNDGIRVRTLTNTSPRESDEARRLEVFPLDFRDQLALTRSLEGVRVLYNTYWVRFNHRQFTHAQAVENSRKLWFAARDAGVHRVVHVSITNPSLDSPFEYFRGKAQVEAALVESGLPHSILRPAVLFGDEDILVNNIAWALRRLPVFGVFGDGEYRLQPIHVDDLADLAVEAGADDGRRIVQAIGPETFTYRNLVETIARILDLRRRIVGVPPRVGHVVGWTLGRILGDVMITWEEIGGLMAGLLAVDAPPAGKTHLSEWAQQHRDRLGREYANELFRRRAADRALPLPQRNRAPAGPLPPRTPRATPLPPDQ